MPSSLIPHLLPLPCCPPTVGHPLALSHPRLPTSPSSSSGVSGGAAPGCAGTAPGSAAGPQRTVAVCGRFGAGQQRVAAKVCRKLGPRGLRGWACSRRVRAPRLPRCSSAAPGSHLLWREIEEVQCSRGDGDDLRRPQRCRSRPREAGSCRKGLQPWHTNARARGSAGQPKCVRTGNLAGGDGQAGRVRVDRQATQLPVVEAHRLQVRHFDCRSPPAKFLGTSVQS